MIDLTDAQMNVLNLLTDGPLDVAAIASSLDLTNNQVHSRLQRLKKRNLVDRIKHDSKHIDWELTFTGRRVVREAISI